MHLGSVAAETPNKPAVIMAGSGRVVTFAELDAASNRLAHVLSDAGLRPGDHIAFMLENRWEFLAVAWAAQRSGLYYTPVQIASCGPTELAYIVDNCEAKVFVASAAVADVAVGIAGATPRVGLRLMLDGVAPGFASYEEMTAAAPATPLSEEVKGADMLYSSGTTGRPKGVKPALPLTGRWALRARSPCWSSSCSSRGRRRGLPLPRAAVPRRSLRYCIAFQRLGATVVVMERFDPEGALRGDREATASPTASGFPRCSSGC